MRFSDPRASLTLALLLLPLSAAADVFINEIHYDTPGSTDVDETVEVVATSGEDLSQYRIVLYNGNGGTTYDDQTLSTGSSVTCGANVSISTFNFTTNGGGQIQNGSPDGLALIGPGNAVIQFLSYEGSFTATNGPASGMTSTDIGVAEDNAGSNGESLQLSGSGSTYAEFTWQGEASSTFGGCNTGQSFGAPVDNPPQLSASTPADGANDFPVNGNLSLTFSEPVTLGANWFQIVCSVSGNRNTGNVVVSGGPSTYSIDPATDFIAGESCTLTLVTSAITDQDGTPDTLVDPGSINFTPAADPPPSVLSTTPMDGNASFPSAGDIVVLFSEPVTVSAGAFTLTCDTSTGISLSHGMSGTSFTINTGTALVAGDACTFTVVAANVVDGGGNNLGADEVVTFTVASSDAGTYYDTVNTSSPEQLRCTLHEIIKGHTIYPYSSGGTGDTWEVLNTADEDPVDSSKILDAYKNESYTKINGGTGAYNREHTWPNSLGFASSSLAAYTDTHMLYLTNVGYNSDRGNMPYINCNAGCTERPTTSNHGEGGGSGVYPGNSNWFSGSGFEVWNHRKGDMARAIFYMAIRYEGIASEDAHDGNIPDLELTDNPALITGTSNTAATAYMGLLSVLLQWHQNDPPDDRERDRNLIVYSFQGNRNPFIDHPEWATLALFQSSQPATCEPVVSAVSANDDSYNATEDTLLSIAAPGVLDNDTADTSITGISLINDVSYGLLTLNNDGSFSYTPSTNYCGADSFVYEATDGSDTDTATVSLTVACVEDGDAPAQNDGDSTLEDTAFVIDVTANDGVDPDPEQNPLTIAMATVPTNGSASIVSGGIQYTPNANYCGGDSFGYSLSGGGSATVNVTITCVNDAPSFSKGGDQTVMEDSGSQTVSAWATAIDDGDADAAQSVFFQVTGNSNSTLFAVQPSVATNGDLSYTPADNAFGFADITLVLRDDGGTANSGVDTSATQTFRINVSAVNDTPVALADSYNGAKDTQLQVAAPGVLDNDTDADAGDTLTAVLQNSPLFGSVLLQADGSFSYTPNAGFCGEDSFHYKANDGSVDSAPVQVTLSIDCLNEAPVAVANSYFGSEDAPFTVSAIVGVLSNDSDANGDELTAVLDDDVQHGSLTLNADGSFDYAPDADYCGSDGFTYHANDGALDSNVVAVTITVQCANDAPVAVNDSYAGTQDTLLTVVAPGVLDNDSDVENDTLSASLDIDVQHGALSLNADGSFSYTPDAGFCGSDSFSYHANDGDDDSTAASVTLQIACVADAIFADGFE